MRLVDIKNFIKVNTGKTLNQKRTTEQKSVIFSTETEPQKYIFNYFIS